MRLTHPLTLLLTLTTTASALTHKLELKRGLPIKKVVGDVAGAVSNLENTTKAFEGDMAPLEHSSNALIKVLSAGQGVAETTPQLSLGEAAGLLHPVKDLEQKTRSLLKTLKAKLEDIRKAKGCTVAREKITSISGHAVLLIDTLFEKLQNENAQEAARPLVDDVKKLLTNSRDVFSENYCPK